MEDFEDEAEPGPRCGIPQSWLNLFYSILIGVAVGSIIAKVWNRAPELPEVAPPMAELRVELVNHDPLTVDVPVMSVRNLSDVSTHNQRLVEMYLSQLGLDSGMYLLAVEAHNYSEFPVELTDAAGSLTLELMDGEVLKSVPFPQTVTDPNGRLRLAQAKLSGELPAESSRTGWKLMPKPVELSAVKRAELMLADGAKIELKPEAK